MFPSRQFLRISVRDIVVVFCVGILVPGDTLAYIAPTQNTQAPTTSRIPPEQLDSLVAPVALYPDPMLAQVLAASTYPLEIMQLQQWLARNPGLKDQALTAAVQKQPWDPSVQALAALPEVAKRLADDIQWTTDLGNTFLAQESDVMDAVQRMRKKAVENGNLKSTEQQKVETQVVESKPVVVIQEANPQVVYVPSYNPVVVWGPPYYPYPPIYYPPPGYYAAGLAISFGIGVAMGAWWGGGWGWGCGWGSNHVTINNNNNFIRNSNIGNGNRGNIGSGNGNRWQHNPEHRGGTPYRDRATADRFGGTARGDSLGNRRANARQQVGRQGGNLPSNRAGAGISGRASGGVNNRPSGVTAGDQGAGIRNRGGAGVGNRSGPGIGDRSSGAAVGNRAGAGGADRVGGRDLSGRNSGGNQSAFAGGSQKFSGSSARASGNRGFSSLGSRGGGGGVRAGRR